MKATISVRISQLHAFHQSSSSVDIGARLLVGRYVVKCDCPPVDVFSSKTSSAI